jgi:hypothetical protein
VEIDSCCIRVTDKHEGRIEVSLGWFKLSEYGEKLNDEPNQIIDIVNCYHKDLSFVTSFEEFHLKNTYPLVENLSRSIETIVSDESWAFITKLSLSDVIRVIGVYFELNLINGVNLFVFILAEIVNSYSSQDIREIIFSETDLKKEEIKKIDKDVMWFKEEKEFCIVFSEYGKLTDDIGQEVLILLFSKLTGRKLMALRSVNSRWKKLIESHLLEKTVKITGCLVKGTRTMAVIPDFLLNCKYVDFTHISYTPQIFYSFLKKFKNIKGVIFDGRYNIVK